MEVNKPVILTITLPVPGHTEGCIQIVKYLVKKGYPCVFVSGAMFEAQLRDAGATFIESTPLTLDALLASPEAPDGALTILKDLRYGFLENMPRQFESLRKGMKMAKEKYPGRQVILLYETFAMALLPFRAGAKLPEGYARMPKVVGFHTGGNSASSIDTAPYGSGLQPATTNDERETYRTMYNDLLPLAKEVMSRANRMCRELGGDLEFKEDWLTDLIMNLPDATLLACSPSLEYPRSESNPNVRCIGGLPRKAVDPNFEYPPWWEEVRFHAALPSASQEKKKIVFVSQGTFMLDYSELIIPCISGLAHREDLLIIATLGSRGASQPAGMVIGKNTKMVDYFPYDAILPYTDVFVCNAGYGGFMHGVMNGVPMIGAGTKADKMDVCARIQWSGLGVNLKTQKPTAEMIREAVDTVLGNEGFKKRALELKRENEGMETLAAIEAQILEFVDA